MKALLVENSKGKTNRSVIVLLPSGEVEPGIGDPANVALEFDSHSNDLRVWVILSDELLTFEIIKEIEISGQFLLKVLEYRNARIEYEGQKVELKDRLLNELVAPNCDALSFLDMGSIVL